MNHLPERLKRRLAVAFVIWIILVCLTLHMYSFRGLDSFKSFLGLAIFLFFLACFDIEIMRDFSNYRPAAQTPNHNYAVQVTYYTCNHGTPSIEIARRIIFEGFKPGPRNELGIAAYFTIEFRDAQNYSRPGGAIIKLYIRSDIPYTHYSTIPGRTPAEKQIHAMHHDPGLVYVPDRSWFIVFGSYGIPVAIPGLEKAEMLDYWGNPITLN